MPSFDVINAAGKAYVLAWRERPYLFQLASVPLFIKYCGYLTVMTLNWEDNFIRQALVMLPSYFADGWMLSHVVRLIFLDQRWPFRPTGNPEEDVQRLHERAQGIMAGTILYALIEFLTTGLMQLLSVTGAKIWETPMQEAAPYAFGTIAFGLAMFWGFRLIWLFIPAALGYSLRRFVNDIRGASTSLYLIGAWSVCFVPVFFFFRFIISLLVAPFGEDLQNLPLTIEMMAGFVIIIMDTTIILLSAMAVSYGLQEMINKRG
jgi:hypothetical protein